MRKNIYLVFYVCLVNIVLVNCTADNEKNSLPEINIENIERDSKVVLSKYFNEDISYVPLESRDECMLYRKLRVYLTDSLIVAFGGENQIFIFNRTSGKFVKEVARRDRSPQGYQKTLTCYPFDEARNSVFALAWGINIYNEYDFDGNLKNKIKLKTGSEEVVTSFVPLNDTLNIGHIWNFNGKQTNKLMFFNSEGIAQKTIPQHNHFEWDYHKNGLNVFSWDGWFYKFKKEVYYLERFTDTIFHVRADNVFPKYVFKSVPFLESIFESDRYLLFNFGEGSSDYIGIYDKLKSSVEIVNEQKGFTNDIDNFVPLKFYSLNSYGEAIGFIPVYEIHKWFDENPEKAIQLSPDLRKLKKLKEADNPVIIIAKLKN